MSKFLLAMLTLLTPLFRGTRGEKSLSILIYHRVMPVRDMMRPDEPTVDEFDWQMKLIRRYFMPIPLGEAVDGLRTGTLPERAVCVTFDDGYSDNERLALPILRKYDIPATVFVSTGFVNGGRMWNDTVIETVRNWPGKELDLRELGLERYPLDSPQRRHAAAEAVLGKIKHLEPRERADRVAALEQRAVGLPNDLMLDDEQMKSLSDCGVELGAHTDTHPILATLDDQAARAEIGGSKQYLETLLGRPVDLFAYPNGKPGTDYTRLHRDMVQELGFKLAVSTHWGAATAASDPFQLPRFTPWDKRELRFALRLLANYGRPDSLVTGS